MSLKIKKDFIKPSKWSRPQVKLSKVLGVVIHYVANPMSSAQGNRNFFNNRTGGYGSAHYIVGLDGEIIQALPDNEMAYHVGSPTYTKRALNELSSYPNNCTLGIEMTHPDATGKPNSKTYESTIKLSAQLLKKHGLTEDSLWLHKEVVGWKNCHKYYVENPSEWKKFKQDVAKELGRNPEQVKEPEKVNDKDVVLVEADAKGMYEIKKGDTLWSLAKAFDTTVEELERLNPDIEATALKVGSKIKVKEVNLGEHTIVRGDTLWALASKYNTTVAKLKELNKGIEAKALQVGAKILVPSGSSSPKKESKPQPKPAKKPDMKTNSIVTYLNSIGEKSDFNSRAKLAKKYGIKNYKGTEKQNLKLLEILRNGGSAPKKSSGGHKHNFTKLGRAKGNVWLHTKPDFSASTRSKVLKTDSKVEICCEQNGLYYTDKGWVSKKYIEIVQNNKNDYDLPSVTLRRGDRGANVVKVQRALNKLYFKCGAEDGVYGAKTEDAVKRFQMVHDAYRVNGIYSPRVEKKMEALLKK